MPTPPNTPNDRTSWVSTSPEVRPAINANWQARRDLAAGLRRLNEAALTSDAPTELLQSMAERVHAEAARLEVHQRLFGNRAHAQQIAAKLGEFPDMFYEVTPAMGQSNAVAPPMHIWQADGRIHAQVTPGWSYEGPFELLHGGVISLLFDQLMGVAALSTGSSGRTGTLTIRYHLPTPINTPLRMVADVERVEGRKQFIVGELWAGDQRTASCEAILVAPKLPNA